MEQKCNYNYHDEVYEDVCIFEKTLDAYLLPNINLTADAIKYRDKLIQGVLRMNRKIETFKRVQEIALTMHK